MFHSNKYFFNIKTSCNCCLLFILACIYLHTCSTGHIKKLIIPTVNIVDGITGLHGAVRGGHKLCCTSSASLFCSDSKKSEFDLHLSHTGTLTTRYQEAILSDWPENTERIALCSSALCTARRKSLAHLL